MYFNGYHFPDSGTHLDSKILNEFNKEFMIYKSNFLDSQTVRWMINYDHFLCCK